MSRRGPALRCSRPWPTRRCRAGCWSTSRSTTASGRWWRSRRAAARRPAVRLWSRNGNEKTAQFPAIVAGARRRRRAASRGRSCSTARSSRSTSSGRPAGFQRLQGRMHLLGRAGRGARRTGAAGGVHRVRHPARRQGRSDAAAADRTPRAPGDASHEVVPPDCEVAQARKGRNRQANGVIRLSEQVAGDARALLRARAEGGMGRAHRQGGRVHLPAGTAHARVAQDQAAARRRVRRRRLDRAAADAPALRRAAARRLRRRARLQYVGQTGTGFDEKELARVSKLLKAREMKTSPFAEPIKTNEPAHWVRPDLVAQIRFTEWTADRGSGTGLSGAATTTRRAAATSSRSPKAAQRDAETPRFRRNAHRHRSAPRARRRAQGRRDHAARTATRVKVTNLAKLFWPPRLTRSPRAICSATTSRSRRSSFRASPIGRS